MAHVIQKQINSLLLQRKYIIWWYSLLGSKMEHFISPSFSNMTSRSLQASPLELRGDLWETWDICRCKRRGSWPQHTVWFLPLLLIESHGLRSTPVQGVPSIQRAVLYYRCVFNSGWQAKILWSNSHFHCTSTWYPARVICTSVVKVLSFLSVNVILHMVVKSRKGSQVWPCQ